MGCTLGLRGLRYMCAQYHRTTGNSRQESWLFAPGGGDHRGVTAAVAAYKRWCNEGKAPLNASLSYQAILQSLPSNESLLLEALRALYDPIPNVVASARVCASLESEAAKSTPRVGGCSNLLLDDFSEDYLAAYEQ